MVLVRDLRGALARLNPFIPEVAREQAIEKLTHSDFARSLLQHNREFYGFIRGGVPVEWRDENGETCHAHARVIDFRNPGNNRFLAARELKIQGQRAPHYNRRADLVCLVNGPPGEEFAEELTVDLSKIDFAKLRDEFAKKVRRKHAALQDIRDVVEKKLAEMLAHNPLRMDYYKKYQEIIADYNREKDQATVEATFAQLVALASRQS